MIYYFSGTGNTRLAADELSAQTGLESRFISLKEPPGNLIQDKDLVFMFPVYAWGIPPVMLEFVRNLPETVVKKVRNGEIRLWCIAVCGDETGMAVENFKEELSKRGMYLDGAWSIIAPNVYVLLPGFDVDKKNIEEEKLNAIKPRTAAIARLISSFHVGDNPIEDVHRGSWPRLKTALVYPLFVKYGISPRKWRWNKECISCGECSKVCPMNNVEMIGGHPKWGNDCVSCLACYHVCPRHAVEYGNATVGKGQFRRLLKKFL